MHNPTKVFIFNLTVMTNNIIFLASLSILFITCAYLSQYVQRTKILEKVGVILIIAFMFGLLNLLNHI